MTHSNQSLPPSSISQSRSIPICSTCLHSRPISETLPRGHRETGGSGVEDYFINNWSRLAGNSCVDIAGMITVLMLDGCSCKACVFVFSRDEIGSYWGNQAVVFYFHWIYPLGSQCSYGFVLLFELLYHNMLLEISVLSSLWQWSCEWNAGSIIG